MPVTVVVGGQYGSEGKGKITAHLALAVDADYVVRCGGPNSGHTVYLGNRKFELRQVPAGFVNSRTRLLIAAGALVNPSILLAEIASCGLTQDRIGVDKAAGVIEPEDVAAEKTGQFWEQFGSTASGVGSAIARRVLRKNDFRLAAEVPELRPYVTSVREELAEADRLGRKIIVEGTQGFGLSLYHTEVWPFRTSRDTTAHAFLSEVGLGVRQYDVVMCIRTYPIRVAGNSGPFPEGTEITWQDVQRESGYPYSIEEFTTTTKRLRRVARFDWGVVEQAVTANHPTYVAVHGADYLDFANKGIQDFAGLTGESQAWLRKLEVRLGIPLGYVGTGPLESETIDLRSRPQLREMQDASFALHGP